MTPDLDSEEVRRAFQKWSNSDAWDGDLDPLVRAAREWLRLREQPAPEVRPKWCNVHQHHKWCEHNGGVMGPTGYAAPDVQAQMIASLSEQVHDMRKGHQAQIDAAVAREREECARVAEWVWDSGNHGAHGGEQANRTAAAIRARSAKGV